MKKIVFLNAGHSNDDPGAVHEGVIESKSNMTLRDRVLPLLKDYDVRSVPDHLSLWESIKWINEKATPDDFGLSLHMNANRDSSIRGVEAYYSNDKEKSLAEVFAKYVSETISIPNGGARHDSKSWVGSLGWLRDLKCDSVLLEACYLTNDEDMKVFDYDKCAKGIEISLKKLFPVDDTKEKELDEIEERLSVIRRLVELLIKGMRKLFLRNKNNYA